MKPIRIHIELRNDEYVKQMESELEALRKATEAYRIRTEQAEMRSGHELLVNIELQDMLNAHGIRYRSTADLRRGKS